MHRRSPRRTTRPALLGVLTCALLLSGCSGDGYRHLEQGRLRVDVPDSWEPGEVAATAFDVVFQDAPEDEDMIYRLAASSDYPDRSARGAIAQLMSFGAFAPDESGGVSRVERDDELAMWRWDMTYDAGEYHMVAWALTEEEFTVLVTVTGRGGLDPAMVERMQDSIAIASESP